MTVGGRKSSLPEERRPWPLMSQAYKFHHLSVVIDQPDREGNVTSTQKVVVVIKPIPAGGYRYHVNAL
jgi:hypothetical protein